MTRIVEHRTALPFGPAMEVHVHYPSEAEFPVHATVEISEYGARLEPRPFPDPLPVADAFLQALAYAERVGIACVWIDDPGGHFPPEKHPVRDVNAP
ncbi:MAG: hypothetical protein ACLP0B_25690 [Steroidobacteraceae bacterium]